jgi:hypothetical protein
VPAAALAVGAGRGETAFGMDEAMVTTLIVYWLAATRVPPPGGPGSSAARGRDGPGQPRYPPCGGAAESPGRPMRRGLRNATIFL